MQDDEYIWIRVDVIDQKFHQIYLSYHDRSYVCNPDVNYN